MLTNFTKRERMLIFVLALILIGLVYYRFIYIGVTQAYNAAKNDADQLQEEVDLANARVARIKNMETEMSGPGLSRMGSYNNIKLETAFMNTVLSSVSGYSVTFAEVSREGNQIRRNFALRFEASSYNDATKVISELTDGEFRCLISNMDCTIGEGGIVNMNVAGTFYETMVGGVEDSALPPEEEDDELAVD